VAKVLRFDPEQLNTLKLAVSTGRAIASQTVHKNNFENHHLSGFMNNVIGKLAVLESSAEPPDVEPRSLNHLPLINSAEKQDSNIRPVVNRMAKSLMDTYLNSNERAVFRSKRDLVRVSRNAKPRKYKIKKSKKKIIPVLVKYDDAKKRQTFLKRNKTMEMPLDMMASAQSFFSEFNDYFPQSFTPRESRGLGFRPPLPIRQPPLIRAPRRPPSGHQRLGPRAHGTDFGIRRARPFRPPSAPPQIPHPDPVYESTGYFEPQDNYILGSGNFGVIRGGIFFDDDDEFLNYHQNFLPQYDSYEDPYGGGGGDLLSNFKDFADIYRGRLSQNREIMVAPSEQKTIIKKPPKNIQQILRKTKSPSKISKFIKFQNSNSIEKDPLIALS